MTSTSMESLSVNCRDRATKKKEANKHVEEIVLGPAHIPDAGKVKSSSKYKLPINSNHSQALNDINRMAKVRKPKNTSQNLNRTQNVQGNKNLYSNQDGVHLTPNGGIAIVNVNDSQDTVETGRSPTSRGHASTFFSEILPDASDEYRSAMTRTMCGLYALVVVVFGIVFPLSSALTHEIAEQSFYMEVFQLYIYSVSLAVLIYLHACVLPHRHVTFNIDDVTEFDDLPSNQKNGRGHELEVKLRPGKKESSGTQTPTESDNVGQPMPAVTTDSEGVNFYLRLGTVVFGTGSMIHDGFKVAQLFETEQGMSGECRQPLYVLVAVVHMIYVFFQTYYLFKSHKVVINMHKVVVRWGLMHMLATNICVWSSATISETAEDFHVTSKSRSNKSSIDNETLEDSIIERCDLQSSLAMKSSPFLFPCTIEYSIVAAAILYKMYLNVGKVGLVEDPDDEQGPPVSECHKANRGLFLGLFVSIVTVIAVAAFFIFDQQGYLDQGIRASTIFFSTELVLLCITSVVCIIGFVKFQVLKFNLNTDGSSLDSNLLIIALSGVCVFNLFLIVSSAHNLGGYGFVGILSFGTALLAFLEATIQTVFILDGLRRSAESQHHIQNKPGRALVTFLLLCNLSLWVVNTFEVRKAETIEIHYSYYGYLPWSIISHMAIPLLIFYRFHSTVCLSDIWINAYVRQKKKA